VTAGEGSPVKKAAHAHSTQVEGRRARGQGQTHRRSAAITPSAPLMQSDPGSFISGGQIVRVGFPNWGGWHMVDSRARGTLIDGGGFSTEIDTEKTKLN